MIHVERQSELALGPDGERLGLDDVDVLVPRVGAWRQLKQTRPGPGQEGADLLASEDDPDPLTRHVDALDQCIPGPP